MKLLSTRYRFDLPDFEGDCFEVFDAVDKIMDFNTNDISYPYIYRKIYRLCAYETYPLFIEKLKDKAGELINQLMARYPVTIIEPQSLDDAKIVINQIHGIYHSFTNFSLNFTSLFTKVDTFMSHSKEGSLNKFLKGIFLKQLIGSKRVEGLTNAIYYLMDDLIDRNSETTLQIDPEFEQLLTATKLLTEEMPSYLEDVKIHSEEKMLRFFKIKIENLGLPVETLDQKDPDDTSEYADSINDNDTDLMNSVRKYTVDMPRMIATMRACLNSVVGSSVSSIVYNRVGKYLTHDASPFFLEIRRSIPMFCFARDLGAIKDIIKLTKIKTDWCGIVKDVAMAASVTVRKETGDEIQVTDFYVKLIPLLGKEGPVLEEGIADFVNKDNSKLIKRINREMHSILIKSSDECQKFLYVLRYLHNKYEFMLTYTKGCLQRLMTADAYQIDRECAASALLQEASAEFDVRMIDGIVNGAAESEEMHLGPILVINTSKWPYKRTFPAPISLASLTQPVTEKYQKIHPSRVLQFPINYWGVYVKDTTRNIRIFGTGVQAEILLFLNHAPYIAAGSLEPQIGAGYLVPALQAMSGGDSPVLKREGDLYLLNKSLSFEGRLLKLKEPKAREEIEEASHMNLQKDRVLDAHIVKHMKTERVMAVGDLWRRVKNEVSGHFPVSENEFRKRLAANIAAGYIEKRTENVLIYKS